MNEIKLVKVNNAFISHLKNISFFIGLLILGGGFTLLLGQDVNFDLKNYHLYNGYAFLTNRLFHDLAPAQLQTYLNPILDIIYYRLVLLSNDPILITFTLGLWYGLLIWSTYQVISILQSTKNTPLAITTTILGTSGVAALGQAGTTTHEVTIAALNMLSVYLLIFGLNCANKISFTHIRYAGLVAGIAVGAKLTSIPFTFTIISMLALFTLTHHKRNFMFVLVNFLLALLLGCLITGGYWHYLMWDYYKNPIFPLYNDFFKSPFYEASNPQVWRWRATTLPKLLSYSFNLSQFSRLEKEEMFSDPRLMIGYISACCLFFLCVYRKLRSKKEKNEGNLDLRNTNILLILAIAWFIAYVLWAYIQGIYRYATFLEAYSAVVFLALICQLKNDKYRFFAMLLVTVSCIYYTHYLSWGRIGYGNKAYDIAPPLIKEQSLVIMLSSRPMSYVIPFFHKETIFVSPQNNFNDINYTNKLQQKINHTIEQWNGPLYAMAPRSFNFMEDPVLKKFKLKVEYVGGDACRPIHSNIDDNIQICGLQRE